MPSRQLRPVILAVLALAAGGGAAMAVASAGDGTATTLGDASEKVASAAYGTALAIQASDHTGLRSYAVPAAGGVVTGWSLHLQKSDAAADIALRMLRPQSAPNVYVVGGQSVGHVEIGTDRTVSFPARIPVQGGDRLSVQLPNSMVLAGTVNGGDGDIRIVPGAAAAAGATVTSQSYQTGGHLLLQAIVEPDADRDTYGDLTQDDCVADAARQAGPCAADLHLTLAASPASIGVGESAVLTAKVTATGGPVTEPTVNIVLPAGLELASAGGTGGDCTGTTTVTCPLGNLPRDGQGRVVLGVRGVTAGTKTASAGVGATSPDPVAGDNGASAAVEVRPTATATTGAAPLSDKLAPTVGLTLPSCPKALSKSRCAARRAERGRYRTLRLTTVDTGGSGVARVEVAIARKVGKTLYVFDGKRFKRSSATAFAKAWRTAAGTGATRTLKLPVLPAGTYTLRLRATDVAGNVSAVVARTLKLR